VIQDSDIDEVERGFEAPGDLLVGLGGFCDSAGAVVGLMCLGLFCAADGELR
jgi:hypothetical protein